jgi:transcriptional antiterminator RfaH
MPLLPLEPFIFPDDLLTNHEMTPVRGPDDSCRWWVLHTRPRAEKSLARRLFPRGVPFFLPLYKRQWRSRGRSLCSHMPLFPGYVFLYGDAQVRLQALETNLLARVLHVEDSEQLQTDLARVYRLMTTGVALGPEERLQPGTPVVVISGPLAGLEGKVLRRGKQFKFFVEIEFLQRGVSVEIDSWMIEPLHGQCLPAMASSCCG